MGSLTGIGFLLELIELLWPTPNIFLAIELCGELPIVFVSFIDTY